MHTELISPPIRSKNQMAYCHPTQILGNIPAEMWTMTLEQATYPDGVSPRAMTKHAGDQVAYLRRQDMEHPVDTIATLQEKY